MTVAATTPREELKPTGTIVQVNATVTPLVQEPNEIEFPYWGPGLGRLEPPLPRPMAHLSSDASLAASSPPYADDDSSEYGPEYHEDLSASNIYRPWKKVKLKIQETQEVGERPVIGPEHI